MNQELRTCIETLQNTQSNTSIGQALAEYAQIVRSIAEEYDRFVTVQDLREDHPELDFMEDDELEEMLLQADKIRAGRAKQDKPEPLRVAASTNPNKLAGSIAHIVREDHRFPTLQVIGAEAVNQATKAVAIANGMLAPSGIRLVISPVFQALNLDGAERTAMLLHLKPMG